MIGPALIAATAIVAAWIAARTANRRQQEQLSHDLELQKAQLAHDRELQGAQLAYDREQRNRQHVRDTIDSAVRGLYASMRQSAEYQGLILTGDEKRGDRRAALQALRWFAARREARRAPGRRRSTQLGANHAGRGPLGVRAGGALADRQRR